MQADLEAQFQEFVKARWARLVRTAYLLTGDAHHAEDLTQTALAKAYRSWRRVAHTDNPEAYVRRMLVTCNSDRFRKRRVPESLTAAPPDVAWRDEGARRVEERGALLDGLAQLPPRQRAVVVLRYWEDLSEAEVAEVLGCSLGTVKSQASKGLAKLRTHPGLARQTNGDQETPTPRRTPTTGTATTSASRRGTLRTARLSGAGGTGR